MRVMKAPTLASAHELAVKMVLEKGWVLETEDKEATVECEEVALRVDHPLTEPMVSPYSRFQRRFMEQYARDLVEGSDSVFEYDYHDRLFNWGTGLCQDSREVHVDQVRYIARKLAASPQSRRAVAVTWNPAVDEGLDDCPCLQLVQLLVRGSLLHMKVVFRSNDMLSAAGANMFALVGLQQHLAAGLGLPCGSYTHISLVPHIYYRRDASDIEPFCGKRARINPVPEVCQVCGRCR